MNAATLWRWHVYALLPLLLATWLLPLAMNAYDMQVAYRALQLLALATAWNLLAGYGGQVSLGTAAFVGLGAYAMSLLSNHWPTNNDLRYLWLLPLCALAAALFAVLVSPALFRLRGLYFTIGSLTLAEALRLFMVNNTATGGTRGIIINAPPPSFAALYLTALVLALLAHYWLQWWLARPGALALQAIRDDEDVARQMGVRSFRVKLLALVLSAALMGMMGGVQAMKLGAIEPYGAFSLSWTIDAVAVTIIGGMGRAWGPLLGTLVYVWLGEELRAVPELHLAITGVFLLLMIRFAPQGLAGVLESLMTKRRYTA